MTQDLGPLEQLTKPFEDGMCPRYVVGSHRWEGRRGTANQQRASDKASTRNIFKYLIKYLKMLQISHDISAARVWSARHETSSLLHEILVNLSLSSHSPAEDYDIISNNM